RRGRACLGGLLDLRPVRPPDEVLSRREDRHRPLRHQPDPDPGRRKGHLHPDHLQGLYLKAAFGRYLGHPDPLAVASNLVALLVGSNQPFYPLALYWMTGGDVTGLFIVFLSAPCFLVVPFVARRSSLMGRVMLVVVGSVDTFISVKVYGPPAGNELYLGP